MNKLYAFVITTSDRGEGYLEDAWLSQQGSQLRWQGPPFRAALLPGCQAKVARAVHQGAMARRVELNGLHRVPNARRSPPSEVTSTHGHMAGRIKTTWHNTNLEEFKKKNRFISFKTEQIQHNEEAIKLERKSHSAALFLVTLSPGRAPFAVKPNG